MVTKKRASTKPDSIGSVCPVVESIVALERKVYLPAAVKYRRRPRQAVTRQADCFGLALLGVDDLSAHLLALPLPLYHHHLLFQPILTQPFDSISLYSPSVSRFCCLASSWSPPHLSHSAANPQTRTTIDHSAHNTNPDFESARSRTTLQPTPSTRFLISVSRFLLSFTISNYSPLAISQNIGASLKKALGLFASIVVSARGIVLQILSLGSEHAHVTGGNCAAVWKLFQQLSFYLFFSITRPSAHIRDILGCLWIVAIRARA